MTLRTQPFCIEPRVQDALDHGLPVVALESTVITHGLPKLQNLELALKLGQTVRTVDVNRRLLQHNAHLAAHIAAEIARQGGYQVPESSNAVSASQPDGPVLQGQL